MRKFIAIENEGYGEQWGLFELTSDTLMDFVMIGDEYHNKISKQIDSFIVTAQYFEQEIMVKRVTLEEIMETEGDDGLLEMCLWEADEEKMARYVDANFSQFDLYV